MLFLKKEINKDFIYKFIIVFLLFIYFLVMLIIYCNTSAKAPDELWFLSIIKKISVKNIKDLLFIQNFLGYGSIYWILLCTIKNILCLRLLAWACLCIVPILIIYIQKKLLNFSTEYIILSIILYLSIPCVWFTGKIIGPELYSNAIGVIGCTLILYTFIKNTCFKFILLFTGGFFLGISSGIKLYNISFAVFIFFFLILSDIKNKIIITGIIKNVLNITIGIISGFLFSNMIIFHSLTTYISNLHKYSSHFGINNISNVLFKNYIEWDLINSSGINYFIMPVFILVLLYIISIKFNKNKTIVIASIISTLFLIIVCSRERFLGWYLMPITFFIPLIIPSSPPQCVSLIIKNIKITYFLIGIVILNTIIMYPFIRFQLKTKIDTINNIKNEGIFMDITTKYNRIYKDYIPIYVLDTSLDYIPYYNITSSKKFDVNNKLILYFSEHSKVNKFHKDIIESAIKNDKKYKFLTKENNVTIILYEPKSE